MVTTIKKLSNGYGYKYAELSTIHEELERQNITYYQYIDYDSAAEADYIYTVLNIGGKDTPPRRGCRVISGGDSMKSAAQAQGSALTYARRYSLLMALGWATEDDDGSTAGKAPQKASAGPTGPKKIDFKQVREHLYELKTIEELNNYWNSLKLTEKQAAILKGDFSERKAMIELKVDV